MTPDMAPVEQSDREAAASNILARLKAQHGGFEQPWMDASTQAMRLGEQDEHYEVQAFARHRLSGFAAGMEAAAKRLEAKAAEMRGFSTTGDMMARVFDEQAASLRALLPTSGDQS